MTKLTYWAAQNKHKNYKGSFEGTPIPVIEFLWTEVVPGGEEELNKRKAEIEADHKKWTYNVIMCDTLTGKETPFIHPVRYLQEVKDYLEFVI
jgi:hypothetical protein